MITILRLLIAWFIFGAIAAVMNFGPPLLAIVAGGPVSLFRTFLFS